MAINLWKLQSNLNWKDTASSTEGITQSSVNYIYIIQLMNWSRFIKTSRRSRKSKHIHDLLHIWTNENTSIDNFSFHFKSFCLFCLIFYLLSHFKITRSIAKSLTVTSTYFFVEIQLKKQKLKRASWVPEFGYPNQPVYQSPLCYGVPQNSAIAACFSKLKQAYSCS